jgi:Transmembrane family 220, helix
MTTRQESTSNTTAVRTTTPSSGKPSPSLWILGLFLFFAAYVNLNDPDFYFWTPAYGLGGALSWYALLFRTNTNGTTANNSTITTSSRIRRNIYKTYLVMSLAVSLGSFSLLWSESTHYRMSGKSDAWWLGVLELEPVREGGGSLLMALAMYLCLTPAPEDLSSRGTSKISSTTRDLVWTTTSGVVAAVAIYLGVILPQYYARLGVAIPEHCGGAAGGSDAEPDNNNNPFLASS